MPKIRKTHVVVNHSGIKKGFEVDINYVAADKRFTIELPDEVTPLFQTLEAKEKQDFFTLADPKTMWKAEHVKKFFTYGETEQEVVARAEKLYTNLLLRNTKRREVIVIHNEPPGRYSGNGSEYNTEHPVVGIGLGILYCAEVSVEGTKPVYRIPSSHYPQGVMIEIGKDVTIIDDTPKNRLFLESMYAALAALKEKVESFITKPEELVKLIQSNQKLIS